MQPNRLAFTIAHHLRKTFTRQQRIAGQVFAQLLGAGPWIRLAVDQFISGMVFLRLAGVAVVQLERQISAGFRDKPDSSSDGRNAQGGFAGDGNARPHRHIRKQAARLWAGQGEGFLSGDALPEQPGKALGNTRQRDTRKLDTL